MKILAVFVLLTIAFSTWAYDLKLNNYLKMQEALANDDFTATLSAHEEICSKELTHYKESYKDCGKKFKDIEELRSSFKQLSLTFMVNGNTAELKNHMTAECPMAKAKWIQKVGTIKNPYYGKSMLECGQKI
ncbi:MAG TPA: hypothetical protein VNJ08_00645 [Bacteriovoracaceae bacterium]|nr:hypothetical protein [Bacteriovoracaceae bacterium]